LNNEEAEMNVNAKIEDFLNGDDLEDLRRYLERVTYEDVYNRSNAGDYESEPGEEEHPEAQEHREAQARRFFGAVGKMRDWLVETGF
jgi:hypothetical protein